MPKKIEVGAPVAFSTKFLRSMAEKATSPRWGDRGVVESIDCDILANIRWADGRRSTANIHNLTRTDAKAGLNQDVSADLGNAWVGMGFQKQLVR